MRAREPSEPISSSEFKSTVTFGAREVAALAPARRSAATSTTSPPFMSLAPGPNARLPGSFGSTLNAWNGESGSKTVSK